MKELKKRMAAAIEHEEFRIVAGRTPKTRITAMVDAALRTIEEAGYILTLGFTNAEIEAADRINAPVVVVPGRPLNLEEPRG